MKKIVKIFFELSIILIMTVIMSSCSFIHGSRVKMHNLRADLPVGFVLQQYEGIATAVHYNYPNVKDNITFVVNGKEDISNYTPGVIKKYLESSISGIDKLEITEFKEITISRKEALRIELSYFVYSPQKQKINQIMIVIFDKYSTYSVTCTLLDKTYERVFEKTIDSIKIKWSIFY